MTTSRELRHIIPIHDGIVMIAYVEDTDIRPFMKDRMQLKPLKEIERLIETVLNQLFPTLQIPSPLWVRPYLWQIGTHAWLPGKLNETTSTSKLLNSLPVIENVHVCGEALSIRQSWIEGSLESAERVLSF
jgi:hypothetical protein